MRIIKRFSRHTHGALMFLENIKTGRLYRGSFYEPYLQRRAFQPETRRLGRHSGLKRARQQPARKTPQSKHISGVSRLCAADAVSRHVGLT